MFKRKKGPVSRTRRHRTLQRELLEGRSLMAGNLAVDVSVNALTLRGDAADNEVAIVQIAPGKLEVRPLAGTTLNRQTAPLSFSNIRSIIVNSAGGDDLVMLEGVETSYFRADLGANYDTVKFTGVQIPEVVFRGREGDDSFELVNSHVDQLKVLAGDGNNRLTTHNVDIAFLEFESGRNNDTIELNSSRIDTIQVSMGAGRDRLYGNLLKGSASEAVDRIFADMGDDRDEVILTSSVFNVATLIGGKGRDRFTFNGSRFGNLAASEFET